MRIPSNPPKPNVPSDAHATQAWVNAYYQNNNPKVVSGPISSGPPGGVGDGGIWIATNVASNGTVWQFRYRANSSSVYKWEFIGGASAESEVTADEGTLSTTYLDLTTIGPGFVLPRAGDYIFEFGAHSYNSGTNSNFVALKRGSAATADTDASQVDFGTANKLATMMRTIRVTGAAAGDTYKLQYRTTAGTGQFRNRWLTVRPVRIS